MEICEEKCAEPLDLLQPELWSKNQLINVLKQRCAHIGDIDGLSKESLIDLFLKNLAPLPQRKYRNNRRGLEVTKKQIQRDKLKRTHMEMSGQVSKDQGSGISVHTPESVSPVDMPKKGLVTTFNLSSSTDRIKPPPSAIRAERKLIKLGRVSPQEASSIKIDQSTPLWTTTKSGTIKLNSKLGATGSNTDFDKIVINTKSSSAADSSNGTATSDKGLAKSGTPVMMPKPKITKIMPKKATIDSPALKIKLKRPDVSTFDLGMSSTSPEECKSNYEHQVALAKDNMQTDAEMTSHTAEKESDATCESPESATEDGVMQKKFKKICVNWP